MSHHDNLHDKACNEGIDFSCTSIYGMTGLITTLHRKMQTVYTHDHHNITLNYTDVEAGLFNTANKNIK